MLRDWVVLMFTWATNGFWSPEEWEKIPLKVTKILTILDRLGAGRSHWFRIRGWLVRTQMRRNVFFQRVFTPEACDLPSSYFLSSYECILEGISCQVYYSETSPTCTTGTVCVKFDWCPIITLIPLLLFQPFFAINFPISPPACLFLNFYRETKYKLEYELLIFRLGTLYTNGVNIEMSQFQVIHTPYDLFCTQVLSLPSIPIWLYLPIIPYPSSSTYHVPVLIPPFPCISIHWPSCSFLPTPSIKMKGLNLNHRYIPFCIHRCCFVLCVLSALYFILL